MKHCVAMMIIAGLCAACAPFRTSYSVPVKGISFDEFDLPSLMDINNGKFSVPDEGLRRLTNVDKSFAECFGIFFDRKHHAYLVRDKSGRILFSGNLDTPRYVASVDIDADNDQDVVIQCAAYGNHGNGAEIYELLINDGGTLRRNRNPVTIDYTAGQENRAGRLTWLSDAKVCASFVGEVADVEGSGSESNPVRVARIRAVKEIWGHCDGHMVLLSSKSSPIDLANVKYLSFR